MGQGRKKSDHSSYGRYRRRSITVENDEGSSDILQYIGPAAVIRSHYNSSACNRDPTPFPGTRTASGTVMSAKKDVKSANASPTNVLFSAESVPFVSTSPQKDSIDETRGENYTIATIIINSLFVEDTIVQNNRRREITTETREGLCKAMEALLDSLCDITTACSAVYYEGDDLVRELFTSRIDAILHYLIQHCLFERIYGLSVHIAFIDRILVVLPSSQDSVHRILYETLVEFSESERCSAASNDDDMYLKDCCYGQIHRLVELWSMCVSVLLGCADHP